MESIEVQYLSLLDTIQTKGVRVQNRTGIDGLSVFSADLRYDRAFTVRRTYSVRW